MNNPLIRAGWFCWLLVAVGICSTLQAQSPEIASPAWERTRTLSVPEAKQGAVADARFVYAINNRHVVKYDRQSGERLTASSGEAYHLNCGIVWNGLLYIAHSNFPKKPDESAIMVLSPETMELTTFKSFGQSEGSLTWAVRHDDHWWCNFAYYGKQNARTYLVKYDDQWQEAGRWRYPENVVRSMRGSSLSGGIWWNDTLLTTGHDEREVYRLRVPDEGDVLEYIETIPVPFTGQGFAFDPSTQGLVGIDRKKREIIFATLNASAAE